MKLKNAHNITRKLNTKLASFKGTEAMEIGALMTTTVGEYVVTILTQPFEPVPTKAESIIREFCDLHKLDIEEKKFHDKQLVILR